MSERIEEEVNNEDEDINEDLIIDLFGNECEDEELEDLETEFGTIQLCKKSIEELKKEVNE